MIPLVTGAARDAWRRWQDNRDVIVAIAGPFLFLPMFAWLLLVPEPAAPAGLTREQAAAIIVDWAAGNLHWLALRIAFELFATAAIFALFFARDHRDVAGVLRHALWALPGFAAAVIASWGLVALGFLAFVVPGLYIYGRVALTGPVMIAEPGIGFAGAVARSLALTHDNGWRVFSLLALTLLAGILALNLIGGIEDALGGPAAINPVAKATVDALAALAAVASMLARILLQVSLYRALAAPRHGV